MQFYKHTSSVETWSYQALSFNCIPGRLRASEQSYLYDGLSFCLGAHSGAWFGSKRYLNALVTNSLVAKGQICIYKYKHFQKIESRTHNKQKHPEKKITEVV